MKYQKNEVLYIVETETDCGSTDFHLLKKGGSGQDGGEL